MKKVLAFVGIAVLLTSVAVAEVNPMGAKVRDEGTPTSRTNGALGSVTISAQQTGALEVFLDSNATTIGGDGVPLVTVFNGNTYTLNDQIWLYGQIYDSPWNGGCTFWTTSPGTDWCDFGEQYFVNSPNAQHSFNVSFTSTVPAVGYYQTYVVARGGYTWPGTSFNWFRVSQTVSHAVVETLYIDSTQPPTPTAPPGGYGGEPIPTLNWLGILAMIAILGGIAVLVMTRK